MRNAERIVDLDALEVPFATGDDGRTYRAVDVVPGARRTYACPGCRGAVSYRKDSRDVATGRLKRVAHFAHKPGAKCGGTGWEHMAHEELKLAAKAIVEQSGVERLCGHPFGVTWERKAYVECPYPRTAYKADIGVTSEDGKAFLGLEVVLTNDMSSEKRRDLLAAGFYLATLNANAFAAEMAENANVKDWDYKTAARSYIIREGFRLVRQPLSREVVPANVTVIGGTAVNCDREEVEPITHVKHFEPDAQDLRRAEALRIWHTRPDLYPEPFDQQNYAKYLMREVR